jgi:hypothetical protein
MSSSDKSNKSVIPLQGEFRTAVSAKTNQPYDYLQVMTVSGMEVQRVFLNDLERRAIELDAQESKAVSL